MSKKRKNVCWLCGEYKKITNHHVIPKSLSPHKNLIIPICQKCHNRIHLHDVMNNYKLGNKFIKDLLNYIDDKNKGFFNRLFNRKMVTYQENSKEKDITDLNPKQKELTSVNIPYIN